MSPATPNPSPFQPWRGGGGGGRPRSQVPAVRNFEAKARVTGLVRRAWAGCTQEQGRPWEELPRAGFLSPAAGGAESMS